MAIDKDSVDNAKDLKGILGEINAAMREMEETSKRVKNGYAATKDSLSNIISVAAQYNQYQKGNLGLSSGQLKSLSERLKAEKDNLKLSQESLAKQIEKNQQQKLLNEQEIRRLAGLKAAGRIIGEQEIQLENLINSNKDLKQTIQEQVTAYEQANDVINDVDGSIKNLEKDLDKAVKRAKSLEIINNIKGGLDKISTPLDGMLNPLQLINKLIGFVTGNFLEVDKLSGEVAKSMNITYEEAGNMRVAMLGVTKASEHSLLNTQMMLETVVSLNEALGSTVKFEELTPALKKDVEFFSKMSHWAGLTAEETNDIAKLTLSTGQGAEKFTGQLMAQVKVSGIQKGIMLNEKTALKEISKTSAAIQMSFHGSAKGLADAYAKSKALGVSLDKVNDIAGGLLNFEESIEAELSAELLTGKDINLEKARQAALNNDLATVAEEIAKITGDSAGFAEMNRLQQESIAKAVGMTREELAASLKEQEALKSMSVASVEDAQKKFDLLVEQKDIEGALAEMGENAITKQFAQLSLQEKANEAMKRMGDTQLPAVVGSLNAMNKNFDSALKKIDDILNKFNVLKGVIIALAAIMAAKFVFQLGMAVVATAAQLASARAMSVALRQQSASMDPVLAKQTALTAAQVAGAEATSFGTVTVAILAGLAAVGAAVAAFSLMSDGVVKPTSSSGFGDRVLFGPEGAISFNNKDTIVAGTDLFKANDMISAPAGNININQSSDNSKDIAELKGAIIALAARPVDVAIDGKKVIEATTGAQPNTQGLESAKNSFRIQ